MKSTGQFTIVRLPVREENAPAWSQSAEFVSDKVILQSGVYVKLFGGSLASQALGRPWKRGVVTIRISNGSSSRCIRRVYGGSGSLSLSQQQIGLDGAACSELGVDWGKEYTLELSGASSPFGRFFDRFLHYWNHPSDSVRASFKLGALGLLYAVKDDVLLMLRGLSSLFAG
jgi:hypothetical protein